jgi:NAD(P)-dependent dehydrogenase (short-subunit alcohol dehydrogenase family)
MTKLTGKVAVITGGNSGIGLATAHRFVQEGAQVVLFGQNQETLAEASAQLGDVAIAVQGDVTNSSDLDRLFATTKQQTDKIDILFVNAGSGVKFSPMEAIDEDLFDQIVNINLKGAYFTIQKSLPLLNNPASIILTTSVNDEIGLPNRSIYSASKAAVRSLARTLSAELVDRGIRVNAVSPGAIATPIHARMGLSETETQTYRDSLSDKIPMKRVGEADEIAKAVVFLASSDSSYILGTELVVDGGFTQL